jgi:hypothetical protein
VASAGGAVGPQQQVFITDMAWQWPYRHSTAVSPRTSQPGSHRHGAHGSSIHSCRSTGTSGAVPLHTVRVH